MRLRATGFEGLAVVEFDAHRDERGSFERLWCAEAFARAGIAFAPCQMSLSSNPRAGTLRGLHWRGGPTGEAKLVRAVRGAIFDVAVDLRTDSPTRGRWFGLELNAHGHRALFLPAGFAHGFVSLRNDSVVLYASDQPHDPALDRGARWDDPAFDIAWPGLPVVIGERDRGWPDWRP